MKLPALIPVLVVAILLLMFTAEANSVRFEVQNLAESTPGGQRFDASVGVANATAMLQEALVFIDGAFYDGNSSIPRQPIVQVTLSVDNDTTGFVAYTTSSRGETNESFIHLSNTYVGGYNEMNGVEKEIKGVLFHESTHVWQWDGQGTAPGGLIEGMADYIRLTAGLAPPHWVKRGAGSRWDEGYAVTAYFLDYCESLKEGFVRSVNAKLAVTTWSLDFFQQLLGKSVDQLWEDYKAKYAGQ